jgi:hypothetical protein
MYYAWPGSVRSACADRVFSTLTKARVHAKYRASFPLLFRYFWRCAMAYARAKSTRVYDDVWHACVRACAYICARARASTHMCARSCENRDENCVCVRGTFPSPCSLLPRPPLYHYIVFVVSDKRCVNIVESWSSRSPVLPTYGTSWFASQECISGFNAPCRSLLSGRISNCIRWSERILVAMSFVAVLNRIDDQSLIRAISCRTRENTRIVKADVQVYSFLLTTWSYLVNREFTGKCHACDWAMDTKIDFQLRAATAARFLRSSRFLRTTNLCYAADHCVCGTLFFYVITSFYDHRVFAEGFACRLLSASYLASWRVSLILISQFNCSIEIEYCTLREH